MPDDPSSKPKDEDLLANAIPIDSLEESEPVAPAPQESESLGIEMAEADDGTPVREIKNLAALHRVEERWDRTPNVTGHGATHGAHLSGSSTAQLCRSR